MSEASGQFEKRKQDHIRFALDPWTEAQGQSGLDDIQLIPLALPDLDFADISIGRELFGIQLNAPIFISSMTAGHLGSAVLNLRLALACEQLGWAMGVGSQRRELFDAAAAKEWKSIRKQAPKVQLFGNIGIAQLIESSTDSIKRLTENLEATALFVHLNALQECLQAEGTPYFAGGLRAIEKLVKELQLPILVKEVGCGIDSLTLKRLDEVGVAAVDVAGLGGTHWGRVEGLRSAGDSAQALAARSFADWGLSTVECLLEAQNVRARCEIWASGGVRNGLDVAKLLALGANMVGTARPMLAAAQQGEESLLKLMQQFEYELRIALFCTGARSLKETSSMRWKWKSQRL